MVVSRETVKVTRVSDIVRQLDDAKNEPVLLEREGTVYHVGRADDSMENFGRMCALLRGPGNLNPDGDLQIAATALTLGLTLLTRHRHQFDRVPGSKLYRANRTT